jgi:flagellar hook-associated protein 1
MLGLFGTLNLAARSLQTQQQGIEVSGQNLANVNNPAYARQRLNISTSVTIGSSLGPQGTGAQAVAIQQMRDALLDIHITSEGSVRGFLEGSEAALNLAQSILGQEIDRAASGPEGTAASLGVGGQHGVADLLSNFFTALQNLSTNPTSLSDRQAVVAKAQDLASRLNQVDSRLGSLEQSLNANLTSDVQSANDLLASLARLNKEIISAEVSGKGAANDLRDMRQEKIEQLAKLVNIQTAAQPSGAVDISINGVAVVTGTEVTDTLQVFDAGGGQMLVRAQTSGTPLTLTGGRMQGTISTRDGALTELRDQVNALAGQMIAEVNAIHRSGYSLTGSTGADLFQGTNASDIRVNGALADDPRLLQMSGEAGAVGNNQVGLALAQLGDQKLAGLGNLTLSDHFAQTVSNLGQSLANTTTQLADQNLVEKMLTRQREAVSGVSLDEEMTELMKFQKAFQASARLVTTLDEMLDTVVGMKR